MVRSRFVLPLVFLLLALAGCSGAPRQYDTSSPCAGGNEASYACQAYRYQNVGM